MTLQQMKRRKDYCFRLHGIEKLIPSIRRGRLDGFTEHAEPAKGVAVLQIGHMDIEVNVFSVAQVSCRREDRENLSPVIDYFVSRKTARGRWEPDGYLGREVKVDWKAPDWKSQLERDMYAALDEYVTRQGYYYAHAN